MKKILSLVTIISLLLTFTIPCLADVNGLDQNKVNELMSEGLTKPEAEKVLRFDNIRNQMEQNGQKIDVVDGKVVFLNPSNSDNCLLKADEEFIKKEFEQRSGKNNDKLLSTEKRHADIEKFIKDNPNVAKKRITYDDGSWIEVNNTVEYCTPIDNEKVNTYAIPNEVETGSTYYTGNGKYVCTSTLKEYNGANFCTVYVSNEAFVSNYPTAPHVYISNVVGGRNYTGIASASDAVTSTGTTVTDYYTNPLDWTLAYTKTTFTLTISTSLTFYGVFTLTINSNASWEEWAAIKCSIAGWHSYVGHL